MILVFMIWVFVFMLCFISGVVLHKASGHNEQDKVIGFDEYFFTGFLALTAVTGILSVFFAVGRYMILLLTMISIVFLLLNFRRPGNFWSVINDFIKQLKRYELVMFFFLLFLLLAAAAHIITFYDSGLYHTQNIRWIRHYPVIPGLANLHGRFGFNSLFFVISALFTFQTNDVLIFPLNGLCFLVLFIKLYLLFKKELTNGLNWKALFYGMTALVSLFILMPDLNSASPDIICGILIIYLIAILIEHETDLKYIGFSRVLLINMLIFSCIVFKLSSALISLFLVIILKEDFRKRFLVSAITGFVFLAAFFIRNYYLSGYLVYPFPGIDLFNVDWKVPFENVMVEKLSVEGWARLPVVPYDTVAGMTIKDWIIPWFKALNLNSIAILIPNIFSVLVLILMLRRKDYFISFIQAIIIFNLMFWFMAAPDPRFVYGFLLAGFALTLSYLTRISEKSALQISGKYTGPFLLILFMLVFFQRRDFPIGIFKDPRLIVIPGACESVETKTYRTNFEYRVPVTGDQCFNSAIPCVPYPFENVVLRSEDIKDGFKVIKDPEQLR